jgi:hypothetical protein
MKKKIRVIPVARASDVPPFSQSRQDAEIEALRFALLELVSSLHQQGTLDLKTYLGALGNAVWLFQGRPASRASALWIQAALAHTRPGPGRAPRGRGKASSGRRSAR